MQQLALSLNNTELQIRRSPRAKRLKVIVNAIGNVEVVVPARASSRQVHEFIRQQQAWINTTKTYIQAQRHDQLEKDKPDIICFPAIDTTWHIVYETGNHSGFVERVGVTNPDDLCLSVRERDCQVQMSRWLTAKAHRLLIPWLDKISDETGLSYNAISIRAQKTRWGSCSARKNINLNRCLLFLEPRLVRYVMVHELCHTVHLNHSASFWQLVKRFAPDYEECEQFLDKACYCLPRWAITQ